jgi:heme exporter protein A
MLSVLGLTISRGERVLIRDLTFGVASGEVVALTGANGAGKTSLLRALAGFLRPDAGAIAYEGADLFEARRRHLHWQGPLDGLKSARRAGDELAFQARYAGADADGIAAAVDLLALTPLLDLEVRQLSAGQKRRLALARLIAAPRPLWLLDEPLSPLDARWRAVMGTLIQAHVDKGGAVIAAVHDPLPVPARTLDLGGGR